MKYIDLTLKRLNKKDDKPEICTLNEAVENNKLIVLLGAPGSGKTSLLKKYYKDHKGGSQVLTIKELIRLKRAPSCKANVVLLDGLDEYRSTLNDKTFVMTELGDRIGQFAESSTVVISCREMDWYGELDVAALKDEVDIVAALYTVLPLDGNQQRKLAAVLEIKDIDAFISQFYPLGFLGNPQMFFMLSKICNNQAPEGIFTKTELYSAFIRNAREQNPSYTLNGINALEPSEILKYAGYLAFYYMFTDIEAFDENFLDKVHDSEAGYSLENLKTTINTSLFYERKFIHRTIAEFALASFLKNEKLAEKAMPGISLSRVKALFARNGQIPTELRGTYAWLCSLSKSRELIAVDPYYQAIHGDNSIFDSELKKEVVLEVKKYSQNVNPYFFRHDEGRPLEGFYTTDLDGFLIDEYKNALKLKNYYVYFINCIISSASTLSESMRNFVKTVVLDPESSGYYKRDLLEIFKDEPAFLIDVLNLVRDNKIKDNEDCLLEALLRQLYPTSITHDEIADYLNFYQKEKETQTLGSCYYLFKTNYVDKYKLVDDIHKKSFDKDRKPQLQLPDNVKTIIDDYFLETLLEYEVSLTARGIFDILKHFKSYYREYDRLRFTSYRYAITDKLPASEDKLQRLTNELFEIYVDDVLSEESDDFSPFRFHYLYNYKTPTNESEVFLHGISLDREPEINKQLFCLAVRHSSKGEGDREEVRTIAEEFALEKDLHDLLNPQKEFWEREDEEREKKRIEEVKQILEKNEEHFAKRTDEDILASFGDLHFIHSFVYFKRAGDDERVSLTSGTFDKLKKLLRKAIFSDDLIDPTLLTIDSLAENSPDAHRNIDQMYYTSCCLNDWGNIEFKEDEFHDYLYINSLMHDKMGDIIKSNLLEQVKTKDPSRVAKILNKYTTLLLKKHLPDESELLLFYINPNDIDKLKSMLRFFVSDNTKIEDELLFKFLNIYSFSISLKDLESLLAIASNEKNKQLILALKILAEGNKSAFDRNMAIAIHSLFSVGSRNEAFIEMDSDLKIQLIDYMFDQFNTAESIEHHSGFQSSKDSCAGFLRNHALGMLNLEKLKKLQEARRGEYDIWTDRITHMISKKGQQDADSQHSPLNVEKIKSFIISDDITSAEDFFADVCDKLNRLKAEIEDNRGSGKNHFYNDDGTGRIEEVCRDTIFSSLNQYYGYDWALLTKEKHEANNRVDINIKYKADNHFEVQIECKRDCNKELSTGISNQLIGKYFSSGVQYGIYLIFYFGKKKNKSTMLKKIHKNIPDDYKSNIKVICIDLVKAQ